jgi:hypothetical protein
MQRNPLTLDTYGGLFDRARTPRIRRTRSRVLRHARPALTRAFHRFSTAAQNRQSGSLTATTVASVSTWVIPCLSCARCRHLCRSWCRRGWPAVLEHTLRGQDHKIRFRAISWQELLPLLPIRAADRSVRAVLIRGPSIRRARSCLFHKTAASSGMTVCGDV